jgi:hypothetical protein
MALGGPVVPDVQVTKAISGVVHGRRQELQSARVQKGGWTDDVEDVPDLALG